MIQVVFKNLFKSEFAREMALDRMNRVVERFPELEKSKINVTLSMENSPIQSGPDLFTARVRFNGGRFNSVTLEKSASSLYEALNDMTHHLLERLNRHGDRKRVKIRRNARKIASGALVAS